MVATLIGRSLLSAVWRVEEEHRNKQEPAPIPHHPTVERTAVDWVQLRWLRSVTHRNAVRIFFFLVLKRCLFASNNSSLSIFEVSLAYGFFYHR